jgi:hypothetical protein
LFIELVIVRAIYPTQLTTPSFPGRNRFGLTEKWPRQVNYASAKNDHRALSDDIKDDLHAWLVCHHRPPSSYCPISSLDFRLTQSVSADAIKV